MEYSKRANRLFGFISILLLLLSACQPPPPAPKPEEALITKGKEIFFNETFNGNGRTCGTCHPESDNFTIDPAFIATLPDDDPLFVAEFIPALKKNFSSSIPCGQYMYLFAVTRLIVDSCIPMSSATCLSTRGLRHFTPCSKNRS